MKLAYLPILAATLMVASAEVQWYVGDRDITCTGHDDGNISCEQGHIGGAEEVDLIHPEHGPKHSANPNTALEDASNDLEKRVTCNIDPSGLACYTHCFAIGYCNSHCDSNNICVCNCLDETAWWNPIVCSDTSCG